MPAFVAEVFQNRHDDASIVGIASTSSERQQLCNKRKAMATADGADKQGHAIYKMFLYNVSEVYDY